jgi:hypothetical protein
MTVVPNKLNLCSTYSINVCIISIRYIYLKESIDFQYVPNIFIIKDQKEEEKSNLICTQIINNKLIIIIMIVDNMLVPTVDYHVVFVQLNHVIQYKFVLNHY